MAFAKESAVGIFVLVGLLAVSYLTIKLGRMEVFSGSGYTVSAQFASVAGLRTGANVEISGVQVGRVAGIHLNQENFMAVVELRLDEGLNLSDDSNASIKTSGLIGDKYISLTPGGAEGNLKPGSIITDTESSLDLEALIGKVVFGGVN